jgi:pimeloyl-ACP methyl ester carboxylesterase
LIDFFRAGVRRTWQTFQYALREQRTQPQKLQSISAPTLVVRGAFDAVAPQRWVEEAARLLPNGHLHVIPRGPHCVNYTTPDALIEAVYTFLQKTAKTSEPLSPLLERPAIDKRVRRVLPEST